MSTLLCYRAEVNDNIESAVNVVNDPPYGGNVCHNVKHDTGNCTNANFLDKSQDRDLTVKTLYESNRGTSGTQFPLRMLTTSM